jgi:MoaA/NifB/PqqE/SkfB family radical SAM enzyme
MDLLESLLVQALPFGAKHVALTGGEPHLHPHFAQMVETIVAYGYTWHFVSHGQRTEPYLPLMERHRERFRHVALSLDGADPATHDAIRNRPGAFEKVQAAARTYIERGFKLRLAVTLNRRNKEQLPALVDLAQEWGAAGMNLAAVIPVDWAADLTLSDAESLDLYQQALDLRARTGFDLRPLSSLYTPGGVNFCANYQLCELTFNARGDLVFCCDTTGEGAVTGSLRAKPLAELIADWLAQSQRLQTTRARQIAQGDLPEKFDTCAFCNRFLRGE